MKRFFAAALTVVLPFSLWTSPPGDADPENHPVFLPVVANGAAANLADPVPSPTQACVGESRLAGNFVATLQLGDANGARPMQYLIDEQTIAQPSPTVKPLLSPSNIYIPGWATRPGATTQIKIDLGQSRCLKRIWYFDDQGIGNVNVYVSPTGSANSWGSPIQTLVLDQYQQWRNFTLNSVQARYVLFEFAAQIGIGELLFNVGSVVPTVTPTPTITSRPDLQIAAMHASVQLGAGGCYVSTNLGIAITVRNAGSVAAGAFDVTVNGVTQRQSAGLGAGQIQSLWIDADGNVVNAMVDSANEVSESNEGNNTRSEMLPVPTLPAPCVTVTPTPTPTQPPNTNAAVLEASSACATGWRVKLSAANARRVDGTTQNAWGQPVGALLDEQNTFKAASPWSQWAPGFQSADNVDEAVIDFGGSAQLDGVWLFEQGYGSGGQLDLGVHAGGAGAWALGLTGSESWQLHSQVTGIATQVRIKRNQPNENIRELVFCALNQPQPSTSTPTPTPTPTATPTPGGPTGVDSQLPKAGLPPTGIWSTQYKNLRQDTLTDWATWITPTHTSYYDTPAYYARKGWIRSHPTRPDSRCIDLHDRHWTLGPDNMVYTTWHPATLPHPDVPGLTCNFGHEHGLDARLSVVFTASGGLPPFGYVLEQHHFDEDTHHGGEHRHEDHVGNKITLSNHYTASFGNAANRTGSTRIYDAGFACSVLSKVHQGAHSKDAFANHLHEYFLTVACNDPQNTAFSVKMLVPFGPPNVFKDTSLNEGDPNFLINLATTPVIGLDGQVISLSTQLQPVTTTNIIPPNPREFAHFTTYMWKSLTATVPETERLNQVDLWTQIVSVKTLKPNGTRGEIQFGPYYIVKNPSRTYDRSLTDAQGLPIRRVIRTINLCYKPNGQKEDTQYCRTAPNTKPAWNSPDSPFNGTYRAVNFKAFVVSNANGYTSFCTDVFGQNPSQVVNGVCQNPRHVLQSSAAITNNWNVESASDPNAKCAPGTTVCGITGSLLGGTPAPGGGYYPAGLGFELTVDQRAVGPIYGEN